MILPCRPDGWGRKYWCIWHSSPWRASPSPAMSWGTPSSLSLIHIFFAAAAADAGWQTVSVDLPGHGDRASEAAALVPWQVVPELRCALAELRGRWDRVGLFGSSLGAWFCLLYTSRL